ncbi:MAG: glycosyltransferase, partial [Chitinophagaceae bacterium]
SILLPVYNAERFLREAVDSLLAQTFTDFELLALNDGSTDGSAAILNSYSDPRLRVLPNDRNRGLIHTLNKGIDVAFGRYIARMDADDICHPERLAAQVAYLDAHPEVAVVASTLDMMDEAGNPIAAWPEDRRHVSAAAIRAFLPVDNCIAHPSVLARAAEMSRYKYDAAQTEAEDYDLWLRMCADGLSIAKIDRPLLRYRVLATSLSRKDKLNADQRLALTKGKFLAQCRRDGKFNAFIARVAFYYSINKARALARRILRK